MSRGCYKAYGRKVNGPTTHASIQFDKIFCENSNKPTASKSAGTVGKWGVTSFTSIRSTNFMIGRRDEGSFKRPRDTKHKDGFGLNPPSVQTPEPKPKKFFKSRVVEQPPPPPPPPRQYSSRPPRLASIVASKKLVDVSILDEVEDDDDEIFPTEALTSSYAPSTPVNTPQHVPSPPPAPVEIKSPSPPPQPQHPPIVLRIFKGTAQILTDDIVPPKKESRRRSHSSESSDGVSSKRHKSKSKDIESLKKDLEDDDSTVPSKKHSEASLKIEKPVSPADNVEVPKGEREKEEVEDVKLEPEPVKEEVVSVQEDTNNSDPLITPSDCSNKEESEPTVPNAALGDPLEIDRIKLLRDLEDDSSVGSGNATVELEIKEEHQEGGDDFSRTEVNKVSVEQDWTSDSESSEVAEKNNAPVDPKVEPKPKVSTRPPKKGSIFKSRGGEKRNAHYIHKWCDIKEEGTPSNTTPASAPSVRIEGDFEFDSSTLTRVTNYPEGEPDSLEECEAVTTVTCSKKAKEFYTVVQNVKKAHQIQESGEFQEFNDDVEYILDALQDNNPISTRCLSAITLASKCMVPAFRMHVRAHGTVTKFFRALHDATKDQRLGMCTATVMFVLSQDRLNMDIDRDSLELMLNLLESDASHNQALEGCGLTDTELQKTKERVRSLCQEIQEQGHAKHLNLDNITVGQLAMETLLSLTSRRAGEWFKEELRDLGGLEHIIKTIVETCVPINESVVEWTPVLLDRVKKADRCLRVLENVTLQNEENANYLLTYRDGILVDTITRLFRICDENMAVFPVPDFSDKNSIGAVLKECLIANLKVLINLTHDFNNKAFGSALTGTKVGLIESSLHVLLEVPAYVPDEQKFDITVLALILLINLVEHCEENRRLLVNAKAPVGQHSNLKEHSSAVSALVTLFIQQEELARTEERKTNAILDGEKTSEAQKSEKSAEEFIEETVALLLQKAGRHMEHTLIGAYIALCLGYLTVDHEEFELYVRSHMPEKNYAMMLSVLQKFYDFMTLTAAVGSGSSRGLKATQMLIKHLTDLDSTIKAELPT